MTADLRSAWRAHRHGPVVRLAMLLAVLTLAVAVTAMHAMGAGHAGGSMAMSHPSAATSDQYGAHHGAQHGGAEPMVPAPADRPGPALHPGSSDHGMGAMCLAVLPLLVLALAHALRRWRRTASVRQQDAVRRLVRTPRAPPPWAAPDLTLLGVSRT